MRYIWLIPLLPGIGAAINGLVGIRSFSRKAAGTVACAMMVAALGLSLLAFWQLLGLPGDARFYDVAVAEWIPRIPLQTVNGVGLFQVNWGFRLDPLSGMMLLVVTGIGTLIHVYSTAYMLDEPRGGFARFFCYLNLFCFFMLMLVLGNNFLVMFVGWEGVGLCSYLLIGYWYEKKSAADAGKKAFITNRIGDWGFVLAPSISAPSRTRPRRCRSRRPTSACCRRSACCCSSARPARARRFRSMSGCRTRWKGRRRSPP
jgi:NADH-quinone oxidoreductase subunit L